jgi:hypothetical protein
MKKLIISAICILFIGLVMYSCSSDKDNPAEPANKLPVISISLADSVQFGLGSLVRITADAEDTDGSVFEVRFFVDNTLEKTMQAEPYFYDLDTGGMSTDVWHSFEAVAEDNSGGTAGCKVYFTITGDKKITVLIPQSGDNWEIGSAKTITWADNLTEKVKIELFKGEQLSTTIADSTESDGTYGWFVPTDIEESSYYKIRISSVNDSLLIGESGLFAIRIIPFIIISYPNGNEDFLHGSDMVISWTDNIEENVKIELYKGAALNRTVSESAPGTGSFNWTIPADVGEGNDFKIRITSAVIPGLFDESDESFSIYSPSVELLIPNGGETFNVGGTREIKWSSNFSGKVKIEFWKNNIYYTTIADSVENSGSYSWTIPAETVLSNDYKIKIISTKNSDIYDISQSFFKTGKPLVSITEPFSNLTNSSTKVQWYGNSNDSTNLTYHYCVSTDTAITNSNALSVLNSSLWKTTENNYANVSFTMVPFNSSVAYVDSTTYTIKAVYSKIFVYAIDRYGAVSDVKSFVYLRINQRPKFPMVYSSKLGVNGFSEYFHTIGPDSTQMVLPAQTEYWKPFDFKWTGSDPDGYDVKLEFKWELWERTTKGNSLVCQSEGWNANNLSVSFDDEIYNWNKQGKYSFKVYVRDDTFEQSENNATVNFEVFTPSFDKGILVLDGNDPDLTSQGTALYMGNPDAAEARNFYEGMLRSSGYAPEGEATDSLHLYRISRFEAVIDTVGFDYFYYDDDGDPSTPEVVDSLLVTRGLYKPDIEELVKYRLVIILSDDRSDTKGVDFNGAPPYTAYTRALEVYLNAGGKVFIAGPSVLMGKYYSSPYQLPISEYKAPFSCDFDGFADSAQRVKAETELFFYKYFGISSMTFPEQKTYYTEITGTNTMQYSADHYLADNYDFIGVEKYTMVTDPSFKNAGMDTVRVNDAWFSVAGTGGRIRSHALKDNGTVFTGIPSFRTSAGENIYKYKSIYDLPRITGNDSLSIDENGQTHYLWNMNKVTGEVHSPVLQRSGTVAARYAHESGIYKTAFFGFPLYFMDNSSNQMTDMFKAMIDWFDLSTDPLGKRR